MAVLTCNDTHARTLQANRYTAHASLTKTSQRSTAAQVIDRRGAARRGGQASPALLCFTIYLQFRLYRSKGYLHPSARRACQWFGRDVASAAQRSARPFPGWCADTYCAAHAAVRSGVLSMANAGPNTNREPPWAYPGPHLRRDWAHPRPHLRRDWARHPVAVPRAAPAQRRGVQHLCDAWRPCGGGCVAQTSGACAPTALAR